MQHTYIEIEIVNLTTCALPKSPLFCAAQLLVHADCRELLLGHSLYLCITM